MATSTTSFEERIARIHHRAATGDNSGFVAPGVADEPISPRAAKKLAQKPAKRRGGYLMSVLGGLAASFAIVGIGTIVLMGGAEGSFEEMAASFLLTSE